MRKIPVILDGDPGHDDAVAWVVAKANPILDIKAITSVAGNQTIEKTTYNAQRICSLIGLDVPIAMGAKKPILADPIIAPNFHGVSGLDGAELPEPKREIEKKSAVSLMHEVIMESEEPVVIIATGPQTNVAELLITHPEVKEKIRLISIMGGGINKGNWTPGAEFNILEDPEAAKVVFESGVDVQMCGLDVTENALVYPEDIEKFFEIDNEVSNVVGKWIEFFIQYPIELGYKGAPLHDPCAVLSITNPEIFTMKKMHVDIELDGEFTRGATIGDEERRNNEVANATVVMDLDRAAFIGCLLDAVSSYSLKGDDCDE